MKSAYSSGLWWGRCRSHDRMQAHRVSRHTHATGELTTPSAAAYPDRGSCASLVARGSLSRVGWLVARPVDGGSNRHSGRGAGYEGISSPPAIILRVGDRRLAHSIQ